MPRNIIRHLFTDQVHNGSLCRRWQVLVAVPDLDLEPGDTLTEFQDCDELYLSPSMRGGKLRENIALYQPREPS